MGLKESLDYSASVIDPSGETVSFSQRLGVSLTQQSMREALDLGAPYEEGDVMIANDPFTTRGLATHLADLYLWKPIFAGRDIVCFLCCFVHATDVGGQVAGSILPSSSEIFQEGLRLPPLRFYRRGELNQDVLKICLLNCRIPDQNWGDLRAMLAAMNTAEQRVHRMVGRFGLETVRRAMSDVLDYAEINARQAIRKIPNGEYHFVDFVDSDLVSGRPIRLQLSMRVRDEEIELDYRGTDYEVLSALNVPVYGKMHQWIAHPFVQYMRTIHPTCPLNSGMFRPLKAIIEPGSIMDPGPNAAVGVRMATVFRIQDLFFGCLAQATRDVVPAASAGQVAIPLVAVPDVASGGTKVSQIQPMLGGCGGRPDRDGIDGRGLTVGSGLMNVPAERLEVDMPVVLRSFGFVTDSAAPGKFRGGAGVRIEFETLSPGTVVTARGMERFRFRPWGLFGGHPGTLGDTILRVKGETPKRVGKIVALHLESGDIVEFLSPSGGGYGDPIERSVGAVARDVRQWFVSEPAAGEWYGVVFKDGRVDLDATEARRAELARTGAHRTFDMGPERDAYERIWPESSVAELNRLLGAVPRSLRSHVGRLLCRFLNRGTPDGQPVTTDDIHAAWSEIRSLLHVAGPGGGWV